MCNIYLHSRPKSVRLTLALVSKLLCFLSFVPPGQCLWNDPLWAISRLAHFLRHSLGSWEACTIAFLQGKCSTSQYNSLYPAFKPASATVLTTDFHLRITGLKETVVKVSEWSPWSPSHLSWGRNTPHTGEAVHHWQLIPKESSIGFHPSPSSQPHTDKSKGRKTSSIHVFQRWAGTPGYRSTWHQLCYLFLFFVFIAKID